MYFQYLNQKTEKANKELKLIYSQFQRSYEMLCESSRNDYIKTLEPGAFIPRDGVLYGEDAKKEFDSMCASLRQKAKEIIEAAVADLKLLTTDAPDSDVVNAITLLNLRKHVTREEISDLLERYGEKPQAWRAIVSVAKEKGLSGFADHPVYNQLQKVNDLLWNVDKTLTLSSAMSGHASKGFVSIIGAMIDDTFPSEQ